MVNTSVLRLNAGAFVTAGQMVRIGVAGIREAGRNTQGVKLINLEEGDKLQAIAPVIAEEHEEGAEPPAAPALS